MLERQHLQTYDAAVYLSPCQLYKEKLTKYNMELRKSKGPVLLLLRFCEEVMNIHGAARL